MSQKQTLNSAEFNKEKDEKEESEESEENEEEEDNKSESQAKENEEKDNKSIEEEKNKNIKEEKEEKGEKEEKESEYEENKNEEKNDNNKFIEKINEQYKEKINNNNKERKMQKLMVMVIPKTAKELPLPLNTLYFFLELFSYENDLKQLTDEDNKLIFYLMNINWLNELKSFYNYKCIEFIIKKELKDNKNFLIRISDLLNTTNPSKLHEDFKLINKFNNIIINPNKIKKKFVDKEELLSPKKVEYDIININKNIASSQLDFLEYFTYYPKCVLINEKMRNILYLEYKYLKFSQFQKGDITLVNDKIYIKLTNKIIEVCTFQKKNLIINPIYILYFFDISNVPFWENVLCGKKDFLNDYLLKRIHEDNKHIQCMLDPYNKEYIGYSINLAIPFDGKPIKKYNFINENISENGIIPTEDELLNEVNLISKFNMKNYYKNKFEDNEKKNGPDDSENKFMLKMKLMREKKEEEILKKKKKYIETVNRFLNTKKSDESGFVNVNGEIIGFVQGDNLTKNGEGFERNTESDFLSDIDDNNSKANKKNKNINKTNPNNIKNENYMNKIKEEDESENDYNGEILMEKYRDKFNENDSNNSQNNKNEEEKKDCKIF